MIGHGDDTNGDEGIDDAEVKGQCMPVEDAGGADRIKVIPSPSPPSRQELLEHKIIHLPILVFPLCGR